MKSTLMCMLCIHGLALGEILEYGNTQPQSWAEQYDQLGLIHSDATHPLLQEFWLLGRYHGQYHWSNGSITNDEGYETRRHRVGFQAKLLDQMMLHAQMVSGSDFEPFYNGFTELWAQWEFTPAITLTIGQQKHRFTHDRNVSSRYINYLERSLITNMFDADYTPALTLLGRADKITYYTGIFSNATSPNMGRAFTELNSGVSLLGAMYYDLDPVFGSDTAHGYLSYVYSDANDRATHLDRFNQGISTAVILTRSSLALIVELTGGIGGDGGSVAGLNLKPSWFVSDNLEIATRYQIAVAEHPTGIPGQRRYEREAGLPQGDLYQALYLGANYYLAGHRLKWMTGMEYATLGDEHVLTASTMVRFYFGPHSGGPFPMNRRLDGHFFQPN